MRKNGRSTRKKERKLRCPVCREFIDEMPDMRDVGLHGFPMLPQPGDLTECERCLALLEYTGDFTSPTLQRASKERVDCFNKLSRQKPRELTVPEVIDYVRRNRQMPSATPAGHAFRKSLKGN